MADASARLGTNLVIISSCGLRIAPFHQLLQSRFRMRAAVTAGPTGPNAVLEMLNCSFVSGQGR